MPLEIQDGAIFIADAHENIQRKDFYKFLELLEKGTIQASQLFLMGDIFDLLVGDLKCTHRKYRHYIEKLEALGKKMPIFYFEGNHDFNLSNLFKYVKVFPIKQQPVSFFSPFGEILMLHGDRYNGFGYTLYVALIRSKITLFFLNFLNYLSKDSILNTLLDKLSKKNICGKIDNFETIISKRVPKFRTQTSIAIVEGHYHQNKKFLLGELIYYNFSSFACDKSYFVVQLSSGINFTQVKLRGKNV